MPIQLRDHAETLLKTGTAPPSRGWTSSLDALTLLHKLASNPASASDALKLLHELQVHQVELDLQNEQLEQCQRDLTAELQYYSGLFDFAPVGYLATDLQGRIIDGNYAAAQFFGVERDDLRGVPVDKFLTADSQPAMNELIAQMQVGQASAKCEVIVHSQDGRYIRLHLLAGGRNGAESLLLTFVDMSDTLATEYLRAEPPL